MQNTPDVEQDAPAPTGVGVSSTRADAAPNTSFCIRLGRVVFRLPLPGGPG